DGVCLGRVDVFAVEEDLAGHAGVGRDFMHAVEAANERRFAATGGPDDGGHQVGFDAHGDVADGAEGAVPGVEVLDLDRAGLLPGLRARPGLAYGRHEVDCRGWRGCNHGWVPRSRPRATRAMMLKASTSKTSTREAAQAWACCSL